MFRGKVLKPFPYSRDGIHTRQMDVGEIEDFEDSVAKGLVTETSGGPYLEKADDAVELQDAVNPAEPVWSGIGDNELVAMIFSKTGVQVNAGNYSHTQLVATARSAMGFDKPARRKGAVAKALSGKQGDDRAMGGVPSPTPAVVVPNVAKVQAPPPPDPNKDVSVKQVGDTAVLVDKKAK